MTGCNSSSCNPASIIQRLLQILDGTFLIKRYNINLQQNRSCTYLFAKPEFLHCSNPIRHQLSEEGHGGTWRLAMLDWCPPRRGCSNIVAILVVRQPATRQHKVPPIILFVFVPLHIRARCIWYCICQHRLDHRRVLLFFGGLKGYTCTHTHTHTHTHADRQADAHACTHTRAHTHTEVLEFQ